MQRKGKRQNTIKKVASGGSLVHSIKTQKKFSTARNKKVMKNKTTAGILAILLGCLGIHKFYLGNNKGGIIYLLLGLCGGIGGILGIIDGIIYLMDTEEKFQERISANKVFDFM